MREERRVERSEKMISISTDLTEKENDVLKRLARLEQRSLSNMIKILIIREALREGIVEREEIIG